MKYYEISISEMGTDKTLTRRYSDVFFEEDNEINIGIALKEMKEIYDKNYKLNK